MNAVKRYCRRVRRIMADPAADQLLNGVREEIADAFPGREPEWEELVAQLGPPEELAETLLAELPVRERGCPRRSVRRWRLLAVLLAAAAALIIAAAVHLHQNDGIWVFTDPVTHVITADETQGGD